MSQTAVMTWQPARRHPETYPGACPDSSYVILDDSVHALGFERRGDLQSAYAVIDGDHVPLGQRLEERGVPALAARHISLAYGANRNPGTLAIKMQNYGYAHEAGLVLPVLKGTTQGRDVVACGLSGQGYLYADLLPADDVRDGNPVEAWFPLLDPEQLRVMHDGEHVRDEVYSVATFPSRLDGFAPTIEALGYAGNDPIFVSPRFGTPIAYSTVHVADRALPAMDAVGVVDHILDIGRLRARLSSITGAATTRDLMAFMNARWWIRFRGEDQPDDRYDRLLDALSDVIAANQRPHSSAAIMAQRGLVLGIDDAYRPGPDRTLGAQLAGARVTGSATNPS